MIDFYFWTTPNGYKILMFLEETGIPYRIMPVNISKGELVLHRFSGLFHKGRLWINQ
jgi:GST-like protein